MKKTFTILLFICAATEINAQDKLYPNEFPLSQITLLEGPLKHARDLNIETLLKYDCDRLMAPYRKEAGLTPKAKCYPNWDGLDGHVGGHYLTAMAINAATGNEECRKRMEYIISEIAECAEANCKNHPQWGVGYMGGMPNSQIFGMALKTETSVYTVAHGHRSTICIRCMPAYATHGYIAATNRQRVFFYSFAIGQYTSHQDCRTNRWNGCLATSMAA